MAAKDKSVDSKVQSFVKRKIEVMNQPSELKWTTDFNLTDGTYKIAGHLTTKQIDTTNPDMVEAFWIEMDDFPNDLDGSGNAQITITDNTAGVNTNRGTARIPIYWLIDSAGNQRNPAAVAVTVQLTSVSGGDTVQSINGIQGLGSPVMLQGKF